MSKTFNVFSNMDKTRRSSNFSSKEVQFLLQLVDKKKEIIESKKTDRLTSEEKVKAWLGIEEEYNEVFSEYRSLKVLKTKYDNLKKNAKRQLPANASHTDLFKTMQSYEQMAKMGNEPMSDNEYSDEDETGQYSNDASNFDTKAQPDQNDNGGINSEAEQCAFETLLLGEAQTATPKISKPQLAVQTSVQTTVQTTEKRKKPIDIWDEVAYKKIKKLNLEMSILDEEWKLRKTKLELELENERSENKLKEDKLKLEIELLKQKLQNKSYPENF